mmetsp:Transcript_19306/g.49095  ORF Transcript_19306/g.49095 Transcript_19306/m.49095 type:complete len:559 (+) Transcript_19306:71-1747(+)
MTQVCLDASLLNLASEIRGLVESIRVAKDPSWWIPDADNEDPGGLAIQDPYGSRWALEAGAFSASREHSKISIPSPLPGWQPLATSPQLTAAKAPTYPRLLDDIPADVDPLVYLCAEVYQISLQQTIEDYQQYRYAVEFLILDGADVNVQESKSLASPLHFAAGACSVPLCEVLLFHKGNIHMRDASKRTPLFWACARPPGVATLRSCEYLVQHKADCSTQSARGNTPAHTAAFYGNVDVLLLFLQHMETINIAGRHGRTPLAIAASKGFTDVVEILVEASGDPTIVDDQGRNALHLAAGCGHTSVCDRLQRRFPRLDSLRDEQGISAAAVMADASDVTLAQVADRPAKHSPKPLVSRRRHFSPPARAARARSQTIDLNTSHRARRRRRSFSSCPVAQPPLLGGPEIMYARAQVICLRLTSQSSIDLRSVKGFKITVEDLSTHCRQYLYLIPDRCYMHREERIATVWIPQYRKDMAMNKSPIWKPGRQHRFAAQVMLRNRQVSEMSAWSPQIMTPGRVCIHPGCHQPPLRDDSAWRYCLYHGQQVEEMHEYIFVGDAG